MILMDLEIRWNMLEPSCINLQDSNSSLTGFPPVRLGSRQVILCLSRAARAGPRGSRCHGVMKRVLRLLDAWVILGWNMLESQWKVGPWLECNLFAAKAGFNSFWVATGTCSQTYPQMAAQGVNNLIFNGAWKIGAASTDPNELLGAGLRRMFFPSAHCQALGESIYNVENDARNRLKICSEPTDPLQSLLQKRNC